MKHISGQHVGRAVTALQVLLALAGGRGRAVHHRRSISGATRESSQRHLGGPLAAHSSLLEGGVREALALAGILALQLPCLTMLCRPLMPLRALSALCAVGGSVDVLYELARRLGGLRGGLRHELARLLRRGHGGLGWVALGWRSGLGLLLLLTRSAFSGVVGGREFLGCQAEGRAKGGGATDRGQTYERWRPVHAIGADLLLLLILLRLMWMLWMLDLKMVTLGVVALSVIALGRQRLEVWVLCVCSHRHCLVALREGKRAIAGGWSQRSRCTAQRFVCGAETTTELWEPKEKNGDSRAAAVVVGSVALSTRDWGSSNLAVSLTD